MVDHSERNLISMFNLERETEAEEEKREEGGGEERVGK